MTSARCILLGYHFVIRLFCSGAAAVLCVVVVLLPVRLCTPRVACTSRVEGDKLLSKAAYEQGKFNLTRIVRAEVDMAIQTFSPC